MLEELQQREDSRTAKYGNVRRIIHTEFQGQKIVAVGNLLFYSPNWKTFIDFLYDYIGLLFTRNWFATQVKSGDEQHPVVGWLDAAHSFRKSGRPEGDGILSGIPDGPTMSYYHLSYDLYVFRDHSLIQGALVQRLKNRDLFQGARYELAAAAAIVRADFEIEMEDEAIKEKKHNEFSATHRKTKEQIEVEAKSRHRAGVLGFKGTAREPKAPKAGIRRLLVSALEKPCSCARVIFVDLNLPPIESDEEKARLTEEIEGTIDGVLRRHGDTSTWSLLALTNFPYHYGDRGEAYPRHLSLFHVPENPKVPLSPEALEAICTAVTQAERIPSSFGEEWERESGDFG